jgi:two-component system chemotaxis response regulator CheY
MKVMVVDDSRAIRSVIARMMRDMGFGVVEAGNGQDAMSCIEAMPEKPGLVLLDWNMPVMDGFACLQEIRRHPASGGIKVMMITTETEVDRMHMALAAGADEYMMKPFTPESLRDKLGLLGIQTN